MKTLNSQDWEELAAQFMAEELLVHTPGDGKLVGRRNFLDLFFIPMHNGVEEYFHPKTLVLDEPWLFVEAVLEYRCVRDHPTFPVQALNAGTTLWVDYFFLYGFTGDRIASLKAVRYDGRLTDTPAGITPGLGSRLPSTITEG
ncbi:MULTISPECIES: hypothetical protein [Protofrankia]|uniref:hypothetical protein n=1 Tax=Protofrankia TaxID=2994361 RepID=UPI0005B94935|nr:MULTISPECIES: hypothetical protein [Protofrankia]